MGRWVGGRVSDSQNKYCGPESESEAALHVGADPEKYFGMAGLNAADAVQATR